MRSYFGGRVSPYPINSEKTDMEKSETHILELEDIILKVHSLHKTVNVKNVQRAKFLQGDERVMTAEMDLGGEPLQETESYYNLTIIQNDKQVELKLKANGFSSILEFMGRSLRGGGY